jgi:recombination protein RecA
MPIDTTSMQDALDAIQKRYGTASFSWGNERTSPPRIPTGSMEIDYATRGGIPIGRFSRFYGNYSAGKSLASWNVVRNAQQMGQTCAVYDAEKTFDPTYVARLGVDVDKLLVIEGSIIEDLCMKMEALLGSVHLHIVDSCSTCLSVHEMDADLHDQRRGGSAKFWTAGLKRIVEYMDAGESGNTIILLDQIRDTFGNPGALPQPPGGRMLEHTSSLSLRFTRGSWLFRDTDGFLTDDRVKQETLSGQAEMDGVETSVKVEKSRVCAQGRAAKVRIDFRDGRYDTGWEMTKAAIFFGVAERSGAWYKMGEKKYQGEKNLRKAIMADEAVQKQIADTMKENW